jgi:hypothetical protein
MQEYNSNLMASCEIPKIFFDELVRIHRVPTLQKL